MATNNAINLRSAGIVSYDGAGNFTALANPLTVPNGGTANSSFTAYTVLCAGTTSTGALQNVASVGSANQVLTSNGPTALPSFQNAPTAGHYALSNSCTSASPADSTTYYISQSQSLTQGTVATAGNATLFIPKSGTITACYGEINVAGTLGSAQNVSIYLRLNDTTDYTVTTTAQCTAASNAFNNAAMSVSVSAGDQIVIKFVTPAWTTNPTLVSVSATFLVT